MHKQPKEPLHEFWYEYTPREISHIHRTKCATCPYRGILDNTICCDYLLITGQARGIRPELCQHHLDMNVIKQNAFTAYGPRKKKVVAE